MYILLAVVLIAVLFAGFVIFRALLCKTEAVPENTRTVTDFGSAASDMKITPAFNEVGAANHLCEMLRLRTVKGNISEFQKFENYLRQTYENIARHCVFERIGNPADGNGFGIIFHIEGRRNGGDGGGKKKSVVLMSHYDVVPATPEEWDFDPFSGVIKDGRILGRGAVDTKCTLAAIMESLDFLLVGGFRPEADLYLCFAGDEETTGRGAAGIAAELKRRGVFPYLILDEGGGVLNGKRFGIGGKSRERGDAAYCAMIGIAEKGYVNIDIKARSGGGHSSVPNVNNPVQTIGRVIDIVNNDLFPFTVTEPMRKTLAATKRVAPFHLRILLANINIFGPLLRKYLCRRQPELAAMTQTVCHVTQITGSNANNVVPSNATAVANLRVISGTSCTSEYERVKRALRGIDVEVVKRDGAREPSKVSVTEGEGWDKLSAAVHSVWNRTVVVPFVMLGATDSSLYSAISDSIYRFSPGKLDTATRKGVHGVNESISLVTFGEMCEFYIKLIKTL